ncbi:EAL domain-containing protein [Oricola sp.]|uniref:putative bifunctional diguanylate cyclase/phosphodiesterase n=1 Tax=Oricola sp. TaxID=1979950 RepID=UPI0025EED8A6|nr:EAL domain-containing protein [Oricola sp.]MCI5074644.1 EAL domain-containing protein [Oricola sp.]
MILTVLANETRLRENTIRELSHVASDIARSISATMGERYADVQAFVLNGAVRDTFNWDTERGRGLIEEAMNGYVEQYDVYPLMLFVDLSGTVIAANTKDALGRPIERPVKPGTQVANTRWFKALSAAQPTTVFIGEAQPVGVVLQVAPDVRAVVPFGAVAQDLNGTATGYWVNFTDLRHISDLSAGYFSRIEQDWRGDISMIVLDSAGRSLLTEHLDVTPLSGVAGDDQLTAFAVAPPMPNASLYLGWSVFLLVPADKALTVWDDLVHTLLIGVATVAIMILGAGLLFGHRVAKPINRLHAVMKALEEGQSDDGIPYIERTDELGAMARSLVVFRERMRAAGEAEAERQAKLVAEALVAERTEELRRSNDEISTRNEWLEGILSNLPVAVCLIDAKSEHALLANRHFEEMYSAPEGRPYYDFLDRYECFRDGFPCQKTTLPSVRAMHGETIRNELLEIREHGAESRFVEVSSAPLFDSDGKVREAVLVIADVTVRQKNFALLEQMAMRDALTQLGNRNALKNACRAAVQSHRPDQPPPCLFLVDIDGFQSINATQGTAFGDQLLIRFGERLAGWSQARDGFLSRLSGDEFGVLLSGCEMCGDAGAQAEMLIKLFDEPFDIAGQSVRVSASIGVCEFSPGVADASELFRYAGLALKEAKLEGDRAEQFSDALRAKIVSQAQADAEIPRGIENEEFELFYQPIVEIGSGSLALVESLVRWRHPERGLLSPAEFLPHAERNHEIVPLSHYLIARAIRQTAQWHREGHDFRTSINIPATLLIDEGLPDQIGSLLAEEQLDSDAIVLEVLEGAMHDADRSAIIIAKLREMGLLIAIDDFGSGYSSLARLNTLPVDVLKFDKSFLRQGMRSRAILKAMIETTSLLGIRGIVEGVETEEHVALLRSSKGLLAQGYYFGRPMPPEALETWIRDKAA